MPRAARSCAARRRGRGRNVVTSRAPLRPLTSLARRVGLLLALCCVLGWPAPLRAHELAIDHLMMWPDRGQGQLHGELTLDPELTRSRGSAPTPESGEALLALLRRELRLVLDGQRLEPEYRVRELWVAGGATLGDLVVFTTPLPSQARQLSVGTGASLPALVVSVQVASGHGASTTSWLLGAGDQSPTYALDRTGGDSGWARGGPEAFEAAARAARAAGHGPAQRRGADATEVLAEVPADRGVLALRFLRLGIEHILPGGLDHVLFVAGVVLGSGRRYRRVLLSLSLFTLAHSVTLALGHFGVVALPARWIEPAIALSIAALGLSNLWRSPDERAGAGRHALIFGFGLLHGLGFASALSSIAFERQHVVLALAAFNVGVELGQVAVVLALAVVGVLVQQSALARRHAVPLGSVAIAAIGLALTIERLAPPPAAAAALPALEAHR